METQMPSSFLDASTFREVPDHQEVWISSECAASVIVEILEHEGAVSDEAAPEHFFMDYADSKEDAEVLSSVCVPPTDLPNLDPSIVRSVVSLRARQKTTKFRGAPQGAPEGGSAVSADRQPHEVNVYMSIVRMPGKNSDILIILNNPKPPPGVTGEAAEGTQGVDDTRAEEWASAAVKGFKVNDWGLFV